MPKPYPRMIKSEYLIMLLGHQYINFSIDIKFRALLLRLYQKNLKQSPQSFQVS